MTRKRAPARTDAGRHGTSTRGRASFTDLISEGVFQDLEREDDADPALEESSFVVSSPFLKARLTAPGIAVRDTQVQLVINQPDLTKLGDKNQNSASDLTQAVAKEVAVQAAKEKSAVVDASPAPIIADVSSSSQKWEEKVEEEESPKIPNPEVVPLVAGDELKNSDLGKECTEKKKKTWANVVGNRDSARGLQLDYVPLSEDGFVEFTDEDIAAGAEAWRTAIVGQIMGESPSFKEMVGFVHRAWSKIEIPRIHQLQPGIFLFNFQSEDAKWKILGRHWTFKQEQILLKSWTPDYRQAPKKPTKIPVWIKLPELDLQFWTKRGIEKIASGVGRPLNTDGLTAKRDAIKYARALVELDMTKPIPQEVKCKLPDGSPYIQQVHYEGIVMQCAKCGVWGHKDIACKREKEVVFPVEQPIQTETTSSPPIISTATVIASSSQTGKEVLAEEVVDALPSEPVVDNAGVVVENTTQQQKKKKKKKKKGNTPLAENVVEPVHGSSSEKVPTVQKGDATVGQENATSNATEVQEKGIPNAASPVDEEGVPAPNKRNRKPNVRIWT